MSAYPNCFDRTRSQGFSLIEVMVAMIVLLFGLLALAGLLARTHAAEFEGYQRKQAVILLQDMVSRIGGNRGAAACYAFTTNTSNGTPYVGTGGTLGTPACAVGTGNPVIPSSDQAVRAIADIGEWGALLLGGAEVIKVTGSPDKQLGAALDARGCVMVSATTAEYVEYRVSVTWRGASPMSMPADDALCAKGSYDTADTTRRIISTIVRVPVLN